MRLVSIEGRIHALSPDGSRGTDLAELTGKESGACQFLGSGGIGAARQPLAALGPGAGVSLESIRLDAPIPKPRMVWAIGLNYRDHIEEQKAETPTVPTVFVKSPRSLIGHEAPIVIPPHVAKPDYEGELAFVIAHRCRDVDEADALDVVAGVTCAHDVSARDHQRATSQWSWSKSFDTFCPLGPALVTLDELPGLDLAIETRINGEVVQSSNTKEMVFPIARLVAHLSRGVTLDAGDVVLTGTPGGVGFARKPPRWLVDGDVVEVEIEGVGILRNPVVRQEAAPA
jgi:2-keto-4-pentenoate hydratase/2-oxohepta-3-ene-1,7-dioic acid hydratase in catechol pathway